MSARNTLAAKAYRTERRDATRTAALAAPRRVSSPLELIVRANRSDARPARTERAKRVRARRRAIRDARRSTR